MKFYRNERIEEIAEQSLREFEGKLGRPLSIPVDIELFGDLVLGLSMLWELRQLVQAGLAPSEVAGKVFDAIRDEKFYILTHADWKRLVQKRMEDILLERNPDEAEVGPRMG